MMRTGFLADHYHIDQAFTPLYKGVKSHGNVNGIVASRQWRALSDIGHDWRLKLTDGYSSEVVLDHLSHQTLRPTFFTDVDFALLSRDAQGHVDQYVIDRTTLDSLGFVAQFYEELSDKNNLLSDIRTFASSSRSIEIGQSLFHAALVRLSKSSDLVIPADFTSEFVAMLNKKPYELTDEDFRAATSRIDEGFFYFIIDPLDSHVKGLGEEAASQDKQSGADRMSFIYKTIAALSHVAEGEDKVRHKDFVRYSREELYPGVPEFIGAFEDAGIEVVALTRGNQMPFVESSNSGIDDLFSRVYTTLIASQRSDHSRDALHPEKKIRPYSILVDNMATEDKVRVIFHETLKKFAKANINFGSEQELLDGIATYLDRCIFLTDSDLEVWATCPIVAVVAVRTPSNRSLAEKFSEFETLPKPIAVLNPKRMSGVFPDFNDADVFYSFDPTQPGLSDLINDMKSGGKISDIYLSRGRSLVATPSIG